MISFLPFSNKLNTSMHLTWNLTCAVFRCSGSAKIHYELIPSFKCMNTQSPNKPSINDQCWLVFSPFNKAKKKNLHFWSHYFFFPPPTTLDFLIPNFRGKTSYFTFCTSSVSHVRKQTTKQFYENMYNLCPI